MVEEQATASAVVFDKVSFAFNEHVVLRDLSFTVPKGSMRIVLGASGAGKSVVLKLILGLLRPDSGKILVNGQRIDNMTEADLIGMRADIGMLFQENALFDSLTVAENVGYRLYEETDMPEAQVRSGVEEVLGDIGLGEPTAQRARFTVLHDGRIYFEGTAAALLASRDDYLQEFLFMTLPPW